MNYAKKISNLKKSIYFLTQEINHLKNRAERMNEVDAGILQYKKQKLQDQRKELSEAKFDQKHHTNPFKELLAIV